MYKRVGWADFFVYYMKSSGQGDFFYINYIKKEGRVEIFLRFDKQVYPFTTLTCQIRNRAANLIIFWETKPDE